MVEPMMYFGIGFLVAALFGLIFIPLVHSRAVRLTMRRLEASTPLSMAEIQADKDQLRAEFAMSTRRLEISVEQLKARTTSQMAELGKKAEAINRLKRELGEKSATIHTLEAHGTSLAERIGTLEDDIGVKITHLHDAARELAGKEAELAKLTGALDARTAFANEQSVAIVALRTQVDALQDQVREITGDLNETQTRLAEERQKVADTARDLAAECTKGESLIARIAELEQALIAQHTEAESLGRRAQELDTRLSEQALSLTERDRQIEHLRDRHDALRKTETDLRAELASIDTRYKSENEQLKAARLSAEEQLDRAREERAKLHKEISAMKRDVETAWTQERADNALLREHINDVAAEVSRLTMVLEGPGSKIETMLAKSTGAPLEAVNGNGLKTDLAPTQGDGGKEGSKGNLADRIRALQVRASAMSAAS